MSGDEYLPRLVDGVLAGLLADVPGVMIVGARATGKTTTAARFAASVVHLDRDEDAAQFRANPDVALAGMAEPVLLDEWQAVPGVLGAVKRAVDRSTGRGRFIVTGSVRDDLLQSAWPITGRLIRVQMEGLSVRETARHDLTAPPFLRRVAAGAEGIQPPADPPDLRGYVELAVGGGFPDPVLGLPLERRPRWHLSYLDQLLTRDAAEVDTVRDPVRLGRFFEAYALNTAGEVSDRKLYEAAGIDRKTAEAYERLLRMLLLVDSVPAWSTNRLKRLVRAPKRYIRDPGLAAAVLETDADGVLRNGNLLGRMIDTFVLAQLRAEGPIYDRPPRLFHLRQEGGAREVDIVAELNYRTVVGLEIKASSAPTAQDARHLVWLRDQLGEIFTGGVVLHTGPHVYRLADRVVAVPIACIWN
jgi:uncharacterized protein